MSLINLRLLPGNLEEHMRLSPWLSRFYLLRVTVFEGVLPSPQDDTIQALLIQTAFVLYVVIRVPQANYM